MQRQTATSSALVPRQHLNTFFLLKKEVRALVSRRQSVCQTLRQIERELNRLDAQGRGKGLPQLQVLRYRELQVCQWREAERLSNMTATLATFGQQIVRLFAVLDRQLPCSERLAVLGGRAQAFDTQSWSEAPLEAMVLRFHAESASGYVGCGPLAIALQAFRCSLGHQERRTSLIQLRALRMSPPARCSEWARRRDRR